MTFVLRNPVHYRAYAIQRAANGAWDAAYEIYPNEDGAGDAPTVHGPNRIDAVEGFPNFEAAYLAAEQRAIAEVSEWKRRCAA
jgi:hypothetical protein